ncbi:MAG: ribosome assembly RNA-binding protein YhbY [Desulforhopalus sp.]|nr:ribosome assembly RNA-binding protein YhbY [Desulforhopalus sp.]
MELLKKPKKKEKLAPAPEINSKQRQYLKGLAHPLNPLVQIGREGLSEGLIEMASSELSRRELLKVKIAQNSGLEKDETANLIAEKTHAAMVQLIGKTIILYRPNPKLDKEKRIRLPK